MRLIQFLLCPVLLAACGDAGTRLPAHGDVLIEGVVLHVDMEPMFRDGDGRIHVHDADYGTVVVLIPARALHLCTADYQVDIGQLADGSQLRARGAVTGRRQIRICAAASHFLAPAAGPSSP